ncbi:MAG TPA: MFS transporter [Pseudolabrys sp.]|nr:MFS transporter [Pseudolabrys sp.]
MTQAAAVIGTVRGSYLRVVGAVSTAHFMSHFYIIALAPLLPFVRDEYGVTYTQLGLAFAVFNIITAVFQTPAGFMVDRLGARLLLVCGMIISASAFVVAGLVNSFWVMVAMFAVAGMGNTVYHPADYALLSRHIGSDRIGQAFSVHTFAGMMGSAVAPAILLMMQTASGWRGAFIGTGAVGFAVAVLLFLTLNQPVASEKSPSPPPSSDKGADAWRILLSGPILLNLVFFVLLATMSAGIYNYSVVALGDLHGTPVTVANAALTGYLLLSAAGVLAGGFLVGRTTRHGLLAAIGLAAMTLSAFLVGGFHFSPGALITLMSIGGFCSGLIMPSRDMLVREVTPAGSFGKVFGFVSTGFSIGGIVSPLVFGAIMDRQHPSMVFFGVGACSLIAIFTLLGRRWRPA